MSKKEHLKPTKFPTPEKRFQTLVKYYKKGEDLVNNLDSVYTGYYLLD
jgi:hypothetical protein